MPTYVYKFLDSGETIEVQQSFSDDALTEAVHPADGVVRPVKKVFTPVGIRFKGSGFYKTDSRSGAKKAASNGSDSAGSSDGKADTSASGSASDSKASDTKPGDAKATSAKASASKSSDAKSSVPS